MFVFVEVAHRKEYELAQNTVSYFQTYPLSVRSWYVALGKGQMTIEVFVEKKM